MLVNLHVKNFAIIDEIDIDFGKHLNILTGETGAGKSILIGSIGIALGARVSSEMIGSHGEYAMVEAVFKIEDEKTREKLLQMDVEMEDGELVISRKITENRSVNKINGVSVPVSLIRQVAALCIDIHGQHEHQSLLNPDKHREIVDRYAGEESAQLREKIKTCFMAYQKQKKEMENADVSEEERARQVGFLEYEKQEIEAAALKPNEIEEIDEEYRRAFYAGTIAEVLGDVHQLCSEKAGSAVAHCLQQLQQIHNLDESVEGFTEELLQIEGLLSDFNHGVASFMSDFSYDERELRQLEQRLDCIHALQSKYGKTYEEIMVHLQEVDNKLLQFADYEDYREKQYQQLQKCEIELNQLCQQLTKVRKSSAEELEERITHALQDLNFAQVDFEIRVSEKEVPTANGRDEIEFMIATNPGEPRRSLGKVASGGELSRIMLAIKSVFADTDDIETLIFDEIDVGISGRTAQKVSEKMSVLGKNHQVICITHLAQIAAMADSHFVIEKLVDEKHSTTRIRPLNQGEMEEELVRILSGVEVTEAVRESAHEMKRLADSIKDYGSGQ